MGDVDRCVCCGEQIPEGAQYCPNCGQCQDWQAVWLHEKEILNGRESE